MFRQDVAHLMYRLDRGAECIPIFVGIILGNAAPVFDRISRNTVDADAVTDDVYRLGESGLDGGRLANLVGEGFVARVILPDRRGIFGERRIRRCHHRQGFIINNNEFGGVLGLCNCFGDNECDGLSDITNSALRQ